MFGTQHCLLNLTNLPPFWFSYLFTIDLTSLEGERQSKVLSFKYIEIDLYPYVND